jgi:hypothetical protein
MFNQTQFQCFYILGSGWGSYQQSGNGTLSNGTVTLSVAYGTVFLNSMKLASAANSATASMGGNKVNVTYVQKNGSLIVTFVGGINLKLNSTLTITLQQ